MSFTNSFNSGRKHKLTDKADDLDLLQKLCSSVYSSNLSNSDLKYMGGIVCSIPTVCIVPLFSICRCP